MSPIRNLNSMIITKIKKLVMMNSNPCSETIIMAGYGWNILALLKRGLMIHLKEFKIRKMGILVFQNLLEMKQAQLLHGSKQ